MYWDVCLSDQSQAWTRYWFCHLALKHCNIARMDIFSQPRSPHGTITKVSLICVALYYELLISKALTLAHVNEESHCHPRVYPQVEWATPALTSQLQSISALWLVIISRPAEARRQSFVKYWRSLHTRRWSPIPVLVAAAGNRTCDHRVASPATRLPKQTNKRCGDSFTCRNR